MPRPTWPPKYVNVDIALLLDDALSPAVFRFFCKLRALAWGEATLTIPLNDLRRLCGVTRSRAYEYARVLRDHRGLLSYAVRNNSFECSFTELSQNPGFRDLPNPLLSLVENNSKDPPKKERRKSQNPGLRDKPAAVEAYRSAAKLWPAKAQWSAIDAAVGAEPARLELWGRVVSGYVLKGWNPRNVAGMLEFFQRGEVPGASNGHKPATDQSEAAGPWRQGPR